MAARDIGPDIGSGAPGTGAAPSQLKQPVTQFALVMNAHQRVCYAARERAQPRFKRSPLFRRLKWLCGRLTFPQHIDQWFCLVENRSHGGGALLADQIVGVEPIRQKRELQAVPGLEMRERGIDGAERGLLASAVAIEAKRGLRHHAPEQLDLFFGEGGAERRDGFVKAALVQRHDVHVAFNRNDAVLVVRNRPRARRVKEHMAFVEERCFGRVEIFGWRILVERAPAERNDAALEIEDWKHDAIAEAVIRFGNIVARDEHAGRRHISVAEAFAF